MHARFLNQYSSVIRLFATVLSPNNPFFYSGQTIWGAQTLVLPDRKYITVFFPGPDLATDASPQTRSVLGEASAE